MRPPLPPPSPSSFSLLLPLSDPPCSPCPVLPAQTNPFTPFPSSSSSSKPSSPSARAARPSSRQRCGPSRARGWRTRGSSPFLNHPSDFRLVRRADHSLFPLNLSFGSLTLSSLRSLLPLNLCSPPRFRLVYLPLAAPSTLSPSGPRSSPARAWRSSWASDPRRPSRWISRGLGRA